MCSPAGTRHRPEDTVDATTESQVPSGLELARGTRREQVLDRALELHGCVLLA